MAFEISDEDVLNVVERVFKIRISFEHEPGAFSHALAVS